MTGQKKAPRAFALYMKERLDIPNGEDLSIENFNVNIDETATLIERAITTMGRNKAAGGGHVHAEMMKANAPAIARTLSKCWKVIGASKQVPHHWLQGTIVLLFKGKGKMGSPKNYRSLCMLGHARKVVEKAVVAQLEAIVKTDTAQFGFQQGIQIEHAVLRVAALIRMGIQYLLVLDLAKAYDSILKVTTNEENGEINTRKLSQTT